MTEHLQAPTKSKETCGSRARRAARIAGLTMILPLTMGTHCGGRPHPGTTDSGAAPGVKEPQAQLPPGGVSCMDDNQFTTGFDCGNGISGAYDVSFGRAHYHVDYNGQRVAGDDAGFPLHAAIDLGGMCLIIDQSNEDMEPSILAFGGSCVGR